MNGGINMKISEAEFEVMHVLWKKGTATSFDIIDGLKEVEEWNQSTIRTLIIRLQEKGAIKIVGKQGKTYTYAPAIKEEKFKKDLINIILEKVYDGSVNNMLLNFVKQKEISRKDLKEIMELIESEAELE